MNMPVRSEKGRWFLRVLQKDINLLVLSVLFGVVVAVLGLSVAVFSQKLIDEIIPSQDRAYLIKAICIVAALLLLRVGASYLQGYISNLHGKRFNLNLINEFFKKLLFLPKSFFDNNPTGTLITRMHDSSAIHGTISFFVNTLIINLVNVVVSASFLFYYSATVGVVALSSFPFFLASALLYKSTMRNRVQSMYVANGENESNYIASIQNTDLIKNHNKQRYFSEKNFRTYGILREKTFKSEVVGLNFGTTSEAIGTFFYLLMLSIAAYQTVGGRLTVGEFAAILGVSTSMLYPIGALGNAVMHLQSARVAFDRMYEVVSREREFREDDDEEKVRLDRITSIDLDNVCFTYESGAGLIDGVSFEARGGEIVCVFGRNGSGKSTLLNLIMALYRPEAGVIRYNGYDIDQLSIAGLRERIAIMSQQTRLFDGSVIYNICLSDDEDCAVESIGYLNALGFDKLIGLLPDKYLTRIEENGNNLSDGQKQIIALARALSKKPDVLLVDEATASLDGESEQFVIDKLHEFAGAGGLVIMVSHRLRPARASTRVVVLDNKKVSHAGTHHELMKTDNLYSRRFRELVH